MFVGTLGTIFGIESADEDPAPLADQMAASGLTVASGTALVVFFTIALQCVSTVALLAREAKSARFAVALMAGYLSSPGGCVWGLSASRSTTQLDGLIPASLE